LTGSTKESFNLNECKIEIKKKLVFERPIRIFHFLWFSCGRYQVGIDRFQSKEEAEIQLNEMNKKISNYNKTAERNAE